MTTEEITLTDNQRLRLSPGLCVSSSWILSMIDSQVRVCRENASLRYDLECYQALVQAYDDWYRAGVPLQQRLYLLQQQARRSATFYAEESTRRPEAAFLQE